MGRGVSNAVGPGWFSVSKRTCRGRRVGKPYDGRDVIRGHLSRWLTPSSRLARQCGREPPRSMDLSSKALPARVGQLQLKMKRGVAVNLRTSGSKIVRELVSARISARGSAVDSFLRRNESPVAPLESRAACMSRIAPSRAGRGACHAAGHCSAVQPNQDPTRSNLDVSRSGSPPPGRRSLPRPRLSDRSTSG